MVPPSGNRVAFSLLILLGAMVLHSQEAAAGVEATSEHVSGRALAVIGD